MDRLDLDADETVKRLRKTAREIGLATHALLRQALVLLGEG